MTLQEIKKEIRQRADKIRKDLPMGVWMNRNQTCWLAGIDSVRMWRLPKHEQPDTIRMANSEMIQIDAAIKWADEFWERQEAKRVKP